MEIRSIDMPTHTNQNIAKPTVGVSCVPIRNKLFFSFGFVLIWTGQGGQVLGTETRQSGRTQKRTPSTQKSAKNKSKFNGNDPNPTKPVPTGYWPLDLRIWWGMLLDRWIDLCYIWVCIYSIPSCKEMHNIIDGSLLAELKRKACCHKK